MDDYTMEANIFVDSTDTETGDFYYGLGVRQSGDEYYALLVSPRAQQWQVIANSAAGSTVRWSLSRAPAPVWTKSAAVSDQGRRWPCSAPTGGPWPAPWPGRSPSPRRRSSRPFCWGCAAASGYLGEEFIVDADHAFTLLRHRRWLLDLIDEWLMGFHSTR